MKLVVITRLRSESSWYVLSMLLLFGCGLVAEARLRRVGGETTNNNNDAGPRSSISKMRSLTTNLTSIQGKIQDLTPLAPESPPPQTTIATNIEENINGIEKMSSWHRGTTTVYDYGGIRIPSPSTNPDDVLFLFLSRSDSPLPMFLDGWTRAAECFKTNNSQSRCWKYSDCEDMYGEYCYRFPDDGWKDDLVTVVFYKKAETEQKEFVFDLPYRYPAWAIMTAIQGIDITDPVRHVETESCDDDYDSVFPSIKDGRKGDILLLSMAFDDGANSDSFGAPPDTEMLGFERGYDETGILFGKQLHKNGPTGDFETKGSGGMRCKDALISMTLKPVR